MSTTKIWDVIILGAGASGLMCAKTASSRGLRVLIIDNAKRAGRKLAIAGGGKGNITNLFIQHTDYVGENAQFTRSALSRFSPKDLLHLVAEEMIPVEEREHGQIFCKHSAEDMVSLLTRATYKCRTLFSTEILSVEQRTAKPTEEITINQTRPREKEASHSPLFDVITTNETYTARSLVIATGSPAWPQIGATDFGATLAKQFGHKVIPWEPALVGLTMQSQWHFAGLEGISINADITVIPDAQEKQRSRESTNLKKTKKTPTRKAINVAKNLPLLFTHKGMSGPASLQASLYYKKGDTLSINFLPEVTVAEIFQQKENGKKQVKTVFSKFFPTRLLERLIPEPLMAKNIAEVSAKDRETVTNTIHAFSVIPAGTEGMKKAEVAKGGVCTKNISSKTMESKLIPGLFFCGEVLDVAGRLGGYNLHWAWASGIAAGESIELLK